MARLNLKGPGRCIFCGGTGLTKEHVFSDWLKTFISQDGFPTRTHLVNIGSRIAENRVFIQRTKRGKQGNALTRKVRVVCKNCNNGWMGVLEERTRPILVPLILDKTYVLRTLDQTALAAWIAKTTITNEFTDPDRAITQEQREWVRLNVEPPPRFEIWIGSYSGSKWRTTAYHHAVGLTVAPVVDRRSPVVNVQSSTFGLGHLLILTLSTTLPPAHAEFQEGAAFPGMVRLWPLGGRDLHWPRFPVLSDADADLVADTLADDLAAAGHTWPKMRPL